MIWNQSYTKRPVVVRVVIVLLDVTTLPYNSIEGVCKKPIGIKYHVFNTNELIAYLLFIVRVRSLQIGITIYATNSISGRSRCNISIFCVVKLLRNQRNVMGALRINLIKAFCEMSMSGISSVPQ